ncbi:MAG: class I SAM-dependent methyltransferase [Deltaproteobacteria bacterium]|nr:class I SAM-dependent methyltransferase [Deltaproteobacteria bacterium]
MAFVCRICSNSSGNKTHNVREMHFGTEEEFEYIECASCGCVQIASIPPDMSKYYPKDYYSFKASRRKYSGAGVLRMSRTRHVLGEGGILGAVAAVFTKGSKILPVAKKAGLKTYSRILDAGAGSSGAFLLKLKKEGFRDIEGADPFIEEDTAVAPGVVVRKAELSELKGPYDAVFMNHSFEHMADPAAALRNIARILTPSGRIVITTPVAGTYAWKTYGRDWVGLDAPRHLHIHTAKSMEVLAKRAGFEILGAVFLSDPSGIWASEQYKKGVSLVHERSYFGKRAKEYFSKSDALFARADMAKFKKLDRELTAGNNSDVVRFYLGADAKQ